MRRNTIKKNPVRVVRIKELMKEEHLSQSQLAEKLHMTQQNLSRIITSEKISDILIDDICSVFPEYSPEWLKGYDQDIKDHFIEAFNMNSLRNTGTDSLIRSLGYDIHRNGSRITLQQNDHSVSISAKKLAQISAEICDYLNYKISKLSPDR